MKKIRLTLIVLILSLNALAQGGPCNSPNPPAWCNGGGGGPCASSNPPAWCGNVGVPINNGLWVLALSGAAFVFRDKIKAVWNE